MADETKLTAATRIEKLLDNIAGGENEVTPATRLEKFLSYIADAMEGGGGSGGGCDCEIDMSGILPIEIQGHDRGDLYVYNGVWQSVGVISHINAPDPEKGLYFKEEGIPGNITVYGIRDSNRIYENHYTDDVDIGNDAGFYLKDTGDIVVQAFIVSGDVAYYTDLSGKNVEWSGGLS